MIAGVHHEGSLGQQLGAGGTIAADTAVQRVNAGSQLGGRKGLGDIVVRAGHQAGDLVHLLRAGSEHDNAHLLVGGADAAADLKAVHVPRHHNIQNGNANVRGLSDGVQRLLTVPRLDGVVPRPLQVNDHKASDIQFIFHNQYFFHMTPLKSLPFSNPAESDGSC